MWLYFKLIKSQYVTPSTTWNVYREWDFPMWVNISVLLYFKWNNIHLWWHQKQRSLRSNASLHRVKARNIWSIGRICSIAIVEIRFVLERQNQKPSKTTKTDFCLSAVTSSSSSCSAIHTEMPTCLAYAILMISGLYFCLDQGTKKQLLSKDGHGLQKNEFITCESSIRLRWAVLGFVLFHMALKNGRIRSTEIRI